MAAPLPAPATYSGGPAASSGDPTAVFGRRVVAAVIDGLVVFVPTVAVASSGMEYITRERVGRDFDGFCDRYIDEIGGACINVDDTAYFTDGSGNGGAFLFLGLALVLFVLLQGLTGWTIGKLLMGLRTVKEDGSPPGIGKALVRWLLWIIDALPCIPLVGGICALTTTGHRRVGDMAASTFVVKASAAGSPIVVPGLTSPATSWGAAPPPWAAAPQPVQPAPSADGPQWDAARGTYIQWDPASRTWLQWDDAARTWNPIPGQ